jgi:D-aminoacyl-tRNA deacylase
MKVKISCMSKGFLPQRFLPYLSAIAQRRRKITKPLKKYIVFLRAFASLWLKEHKLAPEINFYMRAVIQRVSKASVVIDGEIHGAIGMGLLVLLGIEDSDNEEDIDWLARKIVNLRIFNDADGVMNLSLAEVGGDILLVSQFTLHASTKKGNRPSYIRASKPDLAIPLYEDFIRSLENLTGKSIAKGIFGADMKVELLNDGPVTICMDSKAKE